MPLYRFADKIVLFIHIPKTGGSSVEKVLRMAGGIQALVSSDYRRFGTCNPQHFHAEMLERIAPPSFYDYSFVVARNPVDRIISEYKMRKSSNPDLPPFGIWLGNVFARFETNRFALDNHLRPQVDFVTRQCEVFRFEDGISSICKTVLQRAGIVFDFGAMPHERKSANISVEPSDEDIERIAAFYQADFHEFGYTVERPVAA